MGKLFQKRNLGRWLSEPSTLEGVGIIGLLVGSQFGIPPDVVTGLLGAVAANAIRRTERPQDYGKADGQG